jgi:hypothetical protein
MAFTFAELEAWLPGKSYPAIQCTLYITQEDGRCAYSSGYINSFYEHFTGEFAQRFSDRRTQFRVDGVLYDQDFTVQGDSADQTQFQLLRTDQNSFALKLVNRRWGSTDVVAVTKAAEAKIYMGWGRTIGFGSGLALYTFSINSAVETPGIAAPPASEKEGLNP